MSYCTKIGCLRPQNPDQAQFCASCGGRLLLKDRYRPLHPIGSGGFGRTFAAVDEHLPSQSRCVIKQLCFPQQNTANFNKAVELFRQEAVRLDELGQHPQIPQLLAYFEQEQMLYLVEELVAGQTLAQELQQQGAFNEGQIWALLQELLPVLQFVHAHQVIHRDIKPANIMRQSQTHRLFLIDFGVAKLLTSTGILNTGTVVGSPEYIAPEQTRGLALPASDLYSLGVTCIHLLTGVSPFDLFDLRHDRWVWQDYLPLAKGVSAHLSQILNKLLQNALSQRYESATDVLLALQLPTAAASKQLSKGNTFSLTQIWPWSPHASPKPLLSEVGIDYTKLQHLLAARKWLQADQETWAVMCQALSLLPGSYIHSSELDNFPCQDLRTIDQLWRQYSCGRFGFSVQKQIYDSVAGDYGHFCTSIGWPTYNPISPNCGFQFSASAPIGHLPSRIWAGGSHWWRHASTLASKLTMCGIS